MNVADAALQATLIPASTPPSRTLPIAFDSPAELAVPLTSVNRAHSDSNGRHGATALVTDLVVEAALIPYSHWGINE